MADNIRNFNDYRKKVNIEKQETEEINIEIQDPLDFLSASEREEYYRTQHEAMDKERESIEEDSPEYYFDDEPKKQVAQKAQRPEEAEQEESPEYEYEDKPSRRPVREPARKPARKTEKKTARRPEKKSSRDKGRRGREDDDWFDEDEDSEGGINPYLVVRIASALTGIIILILIGMIFKVKVYDVYLKPDPDEVRGTVAVGEVAGYTYTNDKVVTTTELNLRNTPSTVSDDFIEAQVPEGTVLDRIAVSDDGVWAQVEYNEKVLYCVMKYLRVEE